MSEVDANRLVSMLFAAWPRSVPPESARETAAMYRAGIADLSIDETLRAIGECVKACKFLPSVAELRERVDARRRALERAPATKLLEQTPEEVDELRRMAEEVARALS